MIPVGVAHDLATVSLFDYSKFGSNLRSIPLTNSKFGTFVHLLCFFSFFITFFAPFGAGNGLESSSASSRASQDSAASSEEDLAAFSNTNSQFLNSHQNSHQFQGPPLSQVTLHSQVLPDLGTAIPILPHDVFGGTPDSYNLNPDSYNLKQDTIPPPQKTHNRTLPTSNSKKGKSKKKHSKRKKKSVEVENERPPSDRNLFNSIHQQKYLNRNSNLFSTQLPTNLSPNHQNMAPRRSPRSSAGGTDTLKKKNQELEAEIAALKNQMQHPPAAQPASVSPVAFVPYQQSKAENAATKEAAKNVFRNIKFCSGDREAVKITKAVAKFMGKTFQSAAEEAAWIANNKDISVKQITDGRNYVQSRFREKALEWLTNENLAVNPLPTVKEIEDCALRQLDLDNDRERKIFFWYWTVLLERSHATADWSKVMYYKTILEARLRDYPSNRVITTSMEAMAVVVYENYHDRWIATKEWMVAHPNTKLPARDKTNKDMDVFKAKWTDQDGGQQPYGGWDPAAKERFNDLRIAIHAVRADEETLEYEKKALQLLQKEHNITGDEPPKKKKKTGKVRKIVETFFDEME